MSVTYTTEQQNAINARGQVIVSASAGSGKTTVMIERLTSLLLGGETDLKHVLCVTFTNKAAAQMREKLRRGLIKKLAEADEETRVRVKEALNDLPLADISTLHAFCARLVRSNFFLAGADPSFRIISSDDAEGKSLKNKALDEVFEEEYAAGSDTFKSLLAVYFRGKKDAQLRENVLGVFQTVRGTQNYQTLLKETGKDDFESVCDYLKEYFENKAKYCLLNIEEMGAFFAENSKRAFQVCLDVSSAAEALTKCDSFFEMVEISRTFPQIATMPATTKAVGEERKKLLFLKGLSAFCKELYRSLAKFETRETEYEHYLDGQSRAAALAEIALKFDGAYARLKQEANVLDYEDLEHCALKVLADENALKSLLEKYEYVFVDEYQDVNGVQNKLLSYFENKDCFFVGDAKQSIYSFRGSQSKFFVEKTRSLPVSLTLNENFRSAPAVIEAVNRIFKFCMNKDTCDIDYQNEGVMRGGSAYQEDTCRTDEVAFHFIPEFEKEERERGVYSVLGETEEEPDPQAEEIIRIIQNEIGREWYDSDSKEVRRVDYGDIAVLARKTKSKDVGKIVSALSKANIPVTTTAKVNVCDFYEARLVIDLLSYLDNSEQDIPMASAMLSSVGNFKERELATIRLRFPSPYHFRTACREYAAKMRDGISEKLNTFFSETKRLRALAQGKRAAEMIGVLLKSGLEAEIAAKRDGETRLRRVRRLIALAENLSVNAFLRRLKDTSYYADYSESGGENAVKVLTMHAVKGLEYPVVILASLNASFHGADSGDVIYSEKFGFAPRSYQLSEKTYAPTLARYATACEQLLEERKGELNLFYVAATRAKYRLHLVIEGQGEAISPLFAEKFVDFVDFDDCVHYFKEGTDYTRPPLERNSLVYQPDQTLCERILSVYCRPYAYASATDLPVKDSATGFLQREERTFAPVFPRERQEKTSVEEGLAYHAFLEHAAFDKDVKDELSRLSREGLLKQEEIALLKEEQLKKILSLPAFSALSGKRVWREQKFLAAFEAREIPALHADTDDAVILQGAIDLLCEDEKGYLILDYKYSAHDDERIKADYKTQLEIYKKAVEKIMGVKNVRAKIINILRLREIEM